MKTVARRLLLAIFTIGAIAPRVFGQNAPAEAVADSSVDSVADLQREQIAAATANAYSNLRLEIEHSWIDPDHTVLDFVNATQSEDSLRDAIHHAEQIGGPRWIGDETCQVRLEISGAPIAQVFEAAAAAPGSPLAPQALAPKLTGWESRRFAATGSSIRADLVLQLRPTEGGAWNDVDDNSRRAAIAAARDDAVARVLDQIKSVRLSDALTVGQLLQNDPAAADHLARWLRQRPVTALQFTDDLHVRYTLSVGRKKLLAELASAAVKAGAPIPTTEPAITNLRAQFKQEVTSTTGVAAVQSNAKPPGGAPNAANGAVEIPQQPPDWIFKQIDAEATAAFHTSPLRTRQDAEDGASAAIRAKLLARELSPGETVERAMNQNAQVRDSVERALSRTRVFKVSYKADGSVTIHMFLDPRELWYELTP